MNDNGYRLLQLTNNNIGPVAAASILPLGVMSRKIACQSKCTPTFEVTTTANNVAYINEPGYYKVTYEGSLIAGAAGNVVVNLEVNGVVVNTATVTAAAAGTVGISIAFMVRVLNNCCNNAAVNTPAIIQLRNASTIALTGGNSNTIIERVASN